MHYRIAHSFFALTLAAGIQAMAAPLASRPAAANGAPPTTLYSSDPNHLWNRLHRMLVVRTSGINEEADPLFYLTPNHLLDESAHREAMAVLDEFLATHGERLIDDPLRHAILQRDLWTLFDWLAEDKPPLDQEKVRALRSRVALILNRLALTADQIALLPNMYAAAVASKPFAPAYDPAHHDVPFLPPDLFDPKGLWISLRSPMDAIIAPAHTHAVKARSVFEVYFRHPDGRQAGLDYLKRLNSVATTRPAGSDWPQFPPLSQFILLRRALLIDRDGDIRPTRLIESIQIRVYRQIDRLKSARDTQDVFAFSFTRSGLFADSGRALYAVGPDDLVADEFQAHAMIVPERARLLASCAGCHGAPGIESVNSFTRLFSPPPTYSLSEAAPQDQADATIKQKRERSDWGLLRGLVERPVTEAVPGRLP